MSHERSQDCTFMHGDMVRAESAFNEKYQTLESIDSLITPDTCLDTLTGVSEADMKCHMKIKDSIQDLIGVPDLDELTTIEEDAVEFLIRVPQEHLDMSSRFSIDRKDFKLSVFNLKSYVNRTGLPKY